MLGANGGVGEDTLPSLLVRTGAPTLRASQTLLATSEDAR